MAKPLEKPKRRKPSTNGSGKSPLDNFPGTGQPSKAKGFQDELRTSCSMLDEQVLQTLTHHPGEAGKLGVVNGVWIPTTRM